MLIAHFTPVVGIYQKGDFEPITAKGNGWATVLSHAENDSIHSMFTVARLPDYPDHLILQRHPSLQSAEHYIAQLKKVTQDHVDKISIEDMALLPEIFGPELLTYIQQDGEIVVALDSSAKPDAACPAAHPVFFANPACEKLENALA